MALVLFLTAIGITQLTRPRDTETLPPEATSDSHLEVETSPTPYFLTLSALAKEVILEVGEQTIQLRPDSQQLSGSLPLATDQPVIFLTIHWQEPTTAPRFAKLRLEPEGSETLERTFDSVGDLSDVWEPDFH